VIFLKKQIKAMAFALAMLFLLPLACAAQSVPVAIDGMETLPCKAAILMDAETGEVLFEQNADEALPPASVTKVMTLLLVMEALEAGRIGLEDQVRVSANAASMGGSQVFLEEGETMSVEEMLKCVIIASANDCAVALAEFVSGSEEGFVAAMNARAAELGMKNTHFENTNGLDDTAQNHVISARDIAIVSRALIAHPKILEYSGIWMDTIRNGAFGLTNTNRLVRFYPGCTGLKTGSTARAGFCVSATAKREGISLVCVIMGAESRDSRNASAARLLDFGFANYETFRAQGGECRLPVQGSDLAQVLVKWPAVCITVPKGSAARVKVVQKLPVCPMAPVEAGQSVGDIVYTLDGKEVGSVSATAAHGAARIGFGSLFKNLFFHFLLL
jgi:D-alanyl-D-alanine carboxypeptidase (penicillin-binding protein 5/6)